MTGATHGALADSLRTDRRSFRHLQVESAEQIELREWSRMRDELQQERTRLTNRMREQLRRYYPQMLELGGDLGATWFVELWEKAPTPAEAARIRKASIAAILKRNRMRRHDAAGVLRILRQQPLEVGRGTIAAAKAYIESIIPRLQAGRPADQAGAHSSGRIIRRDRGQRRFG